MPKFKLDFEIDEMKQSLGKRARVESLDDNDLIQNLNSNSPKIPIERWKTLDFLSLVSFQEVSRQDDRTK